MPLVQVTGVKRKRIYLDDFWTTKKIKLEQLVTFLFTQNLLDNAAKQLKI